MTGWSLRRRFTAAVMVAAVLVAVLTVLVVVTFERVGTAQEKVAHTYYNALRASSDLLTAYLDQETGIRGYLLTRDVRFRVPYDAGRAEERATLARLDRELAADPVAGERLARVRRAAQAWRDGFADAAVRAVAAAPAPSSAGVSGADQELGKHLFDAVRTEYAGYEDTLLSARETAVEDLDRGRTLLAVAFGALALFVVLALAGLGTALRRWVLDPLDAVRTDVGAVADGDLDHAIASGGPPELDQVAQDVERMRISLLGSYREQVAARASVERHRELLSQQAEDLRRSNAELEQFASVASHDLQEPLRKVASFTELLQRRYAGQLDDRADSYIGFAVEGAHRMQTLINDLLAFSRVGRVGVTRAPVPLGDALRRAEEDLAAAIAETDAVIEVVGPAPLPTVTGDPGLLTQVFQNLVSNALKFRRPGERPVVRISCRRCDDDWQLDVEDNGIGIDPRFADRIFVIFSRLHRREEYPGSGIGLALCKKIVEFHGGAIGLGDHPGPGATIRFTLPISSTGGPVADEPVAEASVAEASVAEASDEGAPAVSGRAE